LENLEQLIIYISGLKADGRL